jgi:hypothetical protein
MICLQNKRLAQLEHNSTDDYKYELQISKKKFILKFHSRVLRENLYLHQRFTQCSKWSTSCILFRSCCNILHSSIKYVIHLDCKAAFKIMVITSHMQKIIQIYPCLLKLSRKQESVTDRRTSGRYNWNEIYKWNKK